MSKSKMSKSKRSNSEESKPSKRTKCQQGLTPVQRWNLDNLPEIPILNIASYLTSRDLISLSHTCKNFHDIFEQDQRVWNDQLLRECPDFSQEFKNVSKSIVDNQTLFSTNNPSKLAFLVYKKTARNWLTPKAALIHRFQHAKEDFNIENFSNYLVGDLKYKIKATDWELDLMIWDVRSRMEKHFTTERIEKLENQVHPKVCLFNTFLMVQFEQGDSFQLAICFIINQEHCSLDEVWRNRHVHSGHIFRQTNVFEQFYVNFGVRKCEKDCELEVELFSMEDGSKLFSKVINCRNCNVIKAACSPDGLLVFSLSDQLILVNHKQNSFQVLQDGNGDVKEIVLKHKHAVCLYEDGYVNLFDLTCGTVLRSLKLVMRSRMETSRIAVDFNPTTNEVCAMYTNPRSRCCIHIRSGILYNPTIEEYGYSQSVHTRDWQLVLDNLVRLEISIFGKYCLKISRTVGAGLEGVDNKYESVFGAQVKLIKVNPFFAAVKDYKFVTIFDFLDLEQYQKKIAK